MKVVLSSKEGAELKCDTGNWIRFKKHDYVSMKKGILHLSFLLSAAESQPCYKLPQQTGRNDSVWEHHGSAQAWFHTKHKRFARLSDVTWLDHAGTLLFPADWRLSQQEAAVMWLMAKQSSRIVHYIWAIVLMRGHSQEKEEGCGGGGDEDFKKRVRRMMPLWGIPDQRLTG